MIISASSEKILNLLVSMGVVSISVRHAKVMPFSYTDKGKGHRVALEGCEGGYDIDARVGMVEGLCIFEVRYAVCGMR